MAITSEQIISRMNKKLRILYSSYEGSIIPGTREYALFTAFSEIILEELAKNDDNT